MTIAEEIAQIDKAIVSTHIIDAPGVIAVGLGLYGKFHTGPAMHSFFEEPSNVNALLLVAGLSVAYCSYRILKLSRARTRLQLAAEKPWSLIRCRVAVKDPVKGQSRGSGPTDMQPQQPPPSASASGSRDKGPAGSPQGGSSPWRNAPPCRGPIPVARRSSPPVSSP